MKVSTRVLCFLAAFMALATVPSAKADTMTLTSPGNGGAAFNVYIGPYVANINGVSTPVICDDFAAASYINESWNANVTNLGTVATGAPAFNSGTGNYSEAAWLTLQLVGASSKTEAAAIQYAIWDLFDPSGVSSYLAGFSGGTGFLTDSANVNGVQYWLNQASGSSLSSSQLAAFLIYTPASCISGPCTTGGLPQEFLVYTPEPGTALMLLIGIAALLWFKRRQHVGRVA